MFNTVKVTVWVHGMNDAINIEVEREYLSAGDINSTIERSAAEAAERAKASVAASR